MEGVTAALVAFVFVCIIFPQLIKHHAQFYTAFALVLIVVLLHAITWGYFFRALTGTLQMAAILLFVLAAGGLTPRQLAGEFANAYEVIRRGEEEKTVIIPLTD